MGRTRSVPGYKRVKEYISRHIHANEWRGGDQVPSEFALTRKLHLSRMTVSRALRELTQDGYLVRTPGSGTFVADHRPAAELMPASPVLPQCLRSAAGERRPEADVLRRGCT